MRTCHICANVCPSIGDLWRHMESHKAPETAPVPVVWECHGGPPQFAPVPVVWECHGAPEGLHRAPEEPGVPVVLGKLKYSDEFLDYC